MSKKIFHLVSANRYTGGAQVAYLWHKTLLEYGFESFFVYKGGYKLEEKIKGEKNTISYGNLIEKIKIIKKNRKNSIFLAHLSEDHWLTFLLSPKNTYLVFHNKNKIKEDFFHKIIYKKVNKSIFAFPSRENYNFKKYKFFPPTYDLKVFYPNKKNYEILKIGTIGKLEKERKHHKFLYLCSEIKKQNFPFSAIVIGRGSYLEELKKLSEYLKIQENVKFIGYYEDKELAEKLRELDMLIWCSEGSQGVHRALGEAQLCGVIPLSFQMEGVEIWIEEGKSGFILGDDYKEGALKIIEIYKDKEKMENLRNYGYLKAKEITSPENFINNFKNFIYEDFASTS